MNIALHCVAWVPTAVHCLIALTPLVVAWLVKRSISFLVEPSSNSQTAPLLLACYVLCSVLHLLYKLTPSSKPRRTASKSTGTEPTADEESMRTKKRVAVIGAGPSGLVTTKELLSQQHTVSCYEKSNHIGGVFAHGFWPGGCLVSSPYTTSYSDFEPSQLNHESAEEYVRYLERYADHFQGVRDAMRLRHEVMRVEKRTIKSVSTFYIHVRVHPEWNSENSTRAGPRTRVDGPFDHVAICCGINDSKNAASPKIPGAESFQGRFLHTSDLCVPIEQTPESISPLKDLAGKRIVTIGLGESIADILGLLADQKKATGDTKGAIIASVRSGAFIIPRVNPLNKKNNDFDSTRIRYALPKAVHNATIVVCTYLRNLLKPCVRNCPESAVKFNLFRLMTERAGGPAYRSPAKSDRFVPAVARGDVDLKYTSVVKIEGQTVYFGDGSKADDIDAILFGTGFVRPSFPFLNNETFKTSAGSELCHCPSFKYLRIFNPDLGSSIGYIGFARPLVGSIPTIAELQARLFALVVGGQVDLPSIDQMKKRIESDLEKSKKEFEPNNGRNWKSLVNWIPYMDSLTYEIGCLPPTRKIFFTKPFLALKIMAGAMISFHYRLVGPGANAELAERVIRKVPYGARKRDTHFFLAIHLTISLLTMPVGVVLAMCPFLVEIWVSLYSMIVCVSEPVQKTDALEKSVSSRCSVSTAPKKFAQAKQHSNSIGRRPPLVTDDGDAISIVRRNPEIHLRRLRSKLGNCFRMNTGRESTVIIMNKGLADSALRCPSLTFNEASLKAKGSRFGLTTLVKDREAVERLTNFFRKGLTGSKVVSYFAERLSSLVQENVDKMASEAATRQNGVQMNLTDIVRRVVFAANVDALFGKGTYTPALYQDFVMFNQEMMRRKSLSETSSTPNLIEASDDSEEDEIQLPTARARLLNTLHKARKNNSDLAPFLKTMTSDLQGADKSEEECDMVALVLLWGGNDNSIPSSAWILALLMKHPDILAKVRQEADLAYEQEVNGDTSLDAISKYSHENRPLLSAVVAEGQRLASKSNMHRVATEDCAISCPMGSSSSRSESEMTTIKKGEWVWMFPRGYLHNDTDLYAEPDKYDPFNHFPSKAPTAAQRRSITGAGSSCPFRPGNSTLRVFGGGRAPCPGKDYALVLLKAAVDSLLLTNNIQLSLAHPLEPLPAPAEDAVAAFPGMSREVPVLVRKGV